MLHHLAVLVGFVPDAVDDFQIGRVIRGGQCEAAQSCKQVSQHDPNSSTAAVGGWWVLAGLEPATNRLFDASSSIKTQLNLSGHVQVTVYLCKEPEKETVRLKRRVAELSLEKHRHSFFSLHRLRSVLCIIYNLGNLLAAHGQPPIPSTNRDFDTVLIHVPSRCSAVTGPVSALAEPLPYLDQCRIARSQAARADRPRRTARRR